MSDTVRKGDLVLIGALAIIDGDDGEGHQNINKDGFEDGLLAVLDNDVSIAGGAQQTRVTRLGQDNGAELEDAIRERFLDAQEIAAAFIREDRQLIKHLTPWLRFREMTSVTLQEECEHPTDKERAETHSFCGVCGECLG